MHATTSLLYVSPLPSCGGFNETLVTPAYAQSEAQCEQVRHAVQQYGYRAARAHAERTLPPEQYAQGRHAFILPVTGLTM
jgi:hypothetical protein